MDEQQEHLNLLDSTIATLTNGVDGTGNVAQPVAATQPQAQTQTQTQQNMRTYIGQDGTTYQAPPTQSGEYVAGKADGRGRWGGFPQFAGRIDARAPLAANDMTLPNSSLTPDRAWAASFPNGPTADRLRAANKSFATPDALNWASTFSGENSNSPWSQANLSSSPRFQVPTGIAMRPTMPAPVSSITAQPFTLTLGTGFSQPLPALKLRGQGQFPMLPPSRI